MNELAPTLSPDRYDRFLRKRAAGSGAGPLDPARLRHRYEAIYAANRNLFRGARVLDLTSASGFWTLAALDAGAAEVTGVEASAPAIESAKSAFNEYGINPESYRFIHSETAAALRKFEAKAFDVVQCHGFLEQSDPRFVFQQLSRLRARHVILDTRLIRGKGPIVRFRVPNRDDAKTNGPERYKSILAIPNHELIKFFCDYFQFGWRVIDWRASGSTDWTGMNDYEHDRRRTYIWSGRPLTLVSRGLAPDRGRRVNRRVIRRPALGRPARGSAVVAGRCGGGVFSALTYCDDYNIPAGRLRGLTGPRAPLMEMNAASTVSATRSSNPH